MNLQRVGLLAAAVLSLAACDDSDDVITTPVTPKSGVRYVNAVPDTIALDLASVDVLENNPYVATVFREMKQGGYTPLTPGDARKFRVFPNSTNIAVTSQRLVDTTLALQPNTNYQFLHVGFARAAGTPKQQLVVRVDTVPTVPAGQVALRIVHVGAGAPNVNVYTTATPAAALPATPTFANVSYLGASPYVFLPTAAGISVRLTAVGSTTVLATATMPAGEAGTTSLDPLPGSTQAGSVFTVYVFGRSVAGSAAPQTAAFTTPGFGTPQAFVPDIQLRTRPAATP